MTLEILKRGNHLGRRMNFKGQFSSYTTRKSLLRLKSYNQRYFK